MAGHSGERITEGLDGLRDRLAEYSQMGARFAKWRAVIAVGDGIPSRGCVEANAQALARYAALCQEAGLVPVVEPEVLMDGEQTLGTSLRSHRGSSTIGLPPALPSGRGALRDDPQARHGALGFRLPRAGIGGGGGRRNGEVSPASRPRGRSGDRIPVGRPSPPNWPRPA